MLLIMNLQVLTEKKAPLWATKDPIPIELDSLPEELLYPERQVEKPKSVKKEKQIVETEQAESDELDPNAAYLSDRTQTAKEQTRAAVDTRA